MKNYSGRWNEDQLWKPHQGPAVLKTKYIITYSTVCYTTGNNIITVQLESCFMVGQLGNRLVGLASHFNDTLPAHVRGFEPP